MSRRGQMDEWMLSTVVTQSRLSELGSTSPMWIWINSGQEFTGDVCSGLNQPGPHQERPESQREPDCAFRELRRSRDMKPFITFLVVQWPRR
ncbi:uncharacterized protein V6R79_024478 [Siganus canaliculatus]